MMWTVECAYTHNENGNRLHRQGAIVQVTDATHAVELICHIPYIHASRPDFGNQIWSGPILRSTSDLIYNKLPKFISCSFNIITAYSFIQ
jgi:hypothetical protein